MTLKRSTRLSLAVAFTIASAGVAAIQDAPSLAGRWDATVIVNNIEIPCAFEIVGDPSSLKGSFFNGERRTTSKPGRLDNGVLVLNFDQLATHLKLSYRDGQLTGEYQRARGAPYPFKATRASAAPAVRSADSAPQIVGTWILAARGSKGETAWRFIVHQTGSEISATILRVDGDTGTLTGSYRDGRFVLSHFSGARPLLLEVTPVDQTTIRMKQNGQTEFMAVRADAPRAKEIGEPTDPARHTTVKDSGEPFRFSFPDLSGHVLTNDDPRFRGKVLLVNITGSWCPNCHDEAPFLSSLFKKYQARGLEVVGLAFEEADQLANPMRLRAFIEEYGIKYTVLLAGEPDQLNEKVPQGVNLNAFPTTFFVGRDGRVRAVHAGFPSPGSGDFYSEAEKDVTGQVERLLAERAPGTK